jgi:hypothetical protein
LGRCEVEPEVKVLRSRKNGQSKLLKTGRAGQDKIVRMKVKVKASAYLTHVPSRQ